MAAFRINLNQIDLLNELKFKLNKSSESNGLISDFKRVPRTSGPEVVWTKFECFEIHTNWVLQTGVSSTTPQWK